MTTESFFSKGESGIKGNLNNMGPEVEIANMLCLISYTVRRDQSDMH